MSNQLKYSYKYEQNYYHNDYDGNNVLRYRRKRKKKVNPIVFLFALIFLGLYGYYALPYNFQHYFRPLILNRILNRNIHLDTSNFSTPISYIHNSYLLDSYILSKTPEKVKEINDIKMVGELIQTKEKLLELFKKYPNLEPSVYVWDYGSAKGIDINASKAYPSASIIKIPIAFELIKLIDESSKTNNPIHLSDKRTFTEFFRTSGSGNLQRTKADVDYTLGHLANIMIAESDNSATNMLLYEIGGMDGFNRAMRNLGLKVTNMHNWLADLEGTNKTTAYEMSKILYNIDNPSYIDVNYRNVLKEYLGNTKNVHLLKEKLPESAMVLHKTGNIKSMLGDSGVVYTDNGKKYIVTILVKRPDNDLRARSLIQEASLIIYNDIKELF